MANKIILSADSTCDLSPELKERYQVQYFPYHILLDGQQYMDGVGYPTGGSLPHLPGKEAASQNRSDQHHGIL